MQTSHNVLVIESLSCTQFESCGPICCKGELRAEIKFYCPVTGNHFRTTVLTTDGRGGSIDGVMRSTIQNFLNGKVYTETKYYDRPTLCSTDTKNIHCVEIPMQEPYKSLFEQLFDLAKWEMPKQALPAY